MKKLLDIDVKSKINNKVIVVITEAKCGLGVTKTYMEVDLNEKAILDR